MIIKRDKYIKKLISYRHNINSLPIIIGRLFVFKNIIIRYLYITANAIYHIRNKINNLTAIGLLILLP